MRVVIVGYGRMGKEVEAICLERGHTIVCRVDTSESLADVKFLNEATLDGIDGVIEFSLADAVLDHAKLYAQTGTKAVIGTTGWESQKHQVESLIKSSKAALLHGSNFSIGAHIMFKLSAMAASLIKDLSDYDIAVHEVHHNKKVDSPSGTALSIAERIIEKLPRKKVVQSNSLNRPIAPEELHVSSARLGSIAGIHTVLLDSAADSIEITHTARSRRGLALGSVLALEWLQGKQGFFRVEDFIDEKLGLGN